MTIWIESLQCLDSALQVLGSLPADSFIGIPDSVAVNLNKATEGFLDLRDQEHDVEVHESMADSCRDLQQSVSSGSGAQIRLAFEDALSGLKAARAFNHYGLEGRAS